MPTVHPRCCHRQPSRSEGGRSRATAAARAPQLASMAASRDRHPAPTFRASAPLKTPSFTRAQTVQATCNAGTAPEPGAERRPSALAVAAPWAGRIRQASAGDDTRRHPCAAEWDRKGELVGRTAGIAESLAVLFVGAKYVLEQMRRRGMRARRASRLAPANPFCPVIRCPIGSLVRHTLLIVPTRRKVPSLWPPQRAHAATRIQVLFSSSVIVRSVACCCDLDHRSNGHRKASQQTCCQ